MTRRTLFQALAGLPIVGKVVAQPSAPQAPEVAGADTVIRDSATWRDPLSEHDLRILCEIQANPDAPKGVVNPKWTIAGRVTKIDSHCQPIEVPHNAGDTVRKFRPGPVTHTLTIVTEQDQTSESR